MKSTDWNAVTKRYEISKQALIYMAEHPLTHEDAINQSIKLKNMALKDEIKRYTEEKYQETFGNGQGTLDEFDWDDIATVIEETAIHFAGLQKDENAYVGKNNSFQHIQKILALGFINYLDENRQDGKMCLSNAECDDIMKAVSEQDWIKLERYAKKYDDNECINKKHI